VSVVVASTTEPDFAPYRAVSTDELGVIAAAHLPARPGLILVDGRSGSGKSTFAGLLARVLGAAVVATDDVAWHLHPTDWAAQMLDGVVQPWSQGREVRYTPPGWPRHGRRGEIQVPSGSDLIIEGVGASRRELKPYAHLTVWVRSNSMEARRRGIERDIVLGRTRQEAETFWDEWMSAERPFLESEQPWARADLVVDGTARPSAAAAHLHLRDGPRG